VWDAIIMGLLLDPGATSSGAGLPDAPSLPAVLDLRC
jgi:hypothetical protein